MIDQLPSSGFKDEKVEKSGTKEDFEYLKGWKCSISRVIYILRYAGTQVLFRTNKKTVDFSVCVFSLKKISKVKRMNKRWNITESTINK